MLCFLLWMLRLFFLLLFEGSNQRANPDFCRTQVADLVNLQHRINLSGSLNDLVHLVCRNRVKAAPK